MTFSLKGKSGIAVIKIQTENAERVSVHFEPFDGTGAGRLAYVCDQDLVELLESQNDWYKIRSIVIDDVKNVRHYEGWVRKNRIEIIKGYALADIGGLTKRAADTPKLCKNGHECAQNGHCYTCSPRQPRR